MELLSRRFAKYFYVILLMTILFHLIDAIISVFNGGCKVGLFIVILFSVVNTMLLCHNIVCNTKQKFTECKIGAKILRVTMLPLLVFHTACVWSTLPLLTIRDNIMLLCVIELVLNYRINCITHLENMAEQFKKENMQIRKGG